MIQITDKSQCCGCTACASICAHDAITIQPDAMGFLYPVVDTENALIADCVRKFVPLMTIMTQA